MLPFINTPAGASLPSWVGGLTSAARKCLQNLRYNTSIDKGNKTTNNRVYYCNTRQNLTQKMTVKRQTQQQSVQQTKLTGSNRTTAQRQPTYTKDSTTQHSSSSVTHKQCAPGALDDTRNCVWYFLRLSFLSLSQHVPHAHTQS